VQFLFQHFKVSEVKDTFTPCNTNQAIKLFYILNWKWRSIHEQVIALVEDGSLSTSTAGGRYGIPGSMAKTRLHKLPDEWASWKAPKNRAMAHVQSCSGYWFSTRSPKKTFSQYKGTRVCQKPSWTGIYSYLKLIKAGFTVWHAAVKDVLTDEPKLDCQAFVDSSVAHQ
jgi:hypothetical protein